MRLRAAISLATVDCLASACAAAALLQIIEHHRFTKPFALFVPLSLRCASLPQYSHVNLQAECSRTLATYSALDTLVLFFRIAA